jgi:hypothetical protein
MFTQAIEQAQRNGGYVMENIPGVPKGAQFVMDASGRPTTVQGAYQMRLPDGSAFYINPNSYVVRADEAPVSMASNTPTQQLQGKPNNAVPSAAAPSADPLKTAAGNKRDTVASIQPDPVVTPQAAKPDTSYEEALQFAKDNRVRLDDDARKEMVDAYVSTSNDAQRELVMLNNAIKRSNPSNRKAAQAAYDAKVKEIGDRQEAYVGKLATAAQQITDGTTAVEAAAILKPLVTEDPAAFKAAVKSQPVMRFVLGKIDPDYDRSYRLADELRAKIDSGPRDERKQARSEYKKNFEYVKQQEDWYKKVFNLVMRQ